MDHVIKCVVIPSHVILPDLLIKCSQSEQSHDIGICPAYSDIQRFLAWNIKAVLQIGQIISISHLRSSSCDGQPGV